MEGGGDGGATSHGGAPPAKRTKNYGTVHYTQPDTGQIKTGIICSDGVRIEVPGEGIFSGVLEWLKEARLQDPPGEDDGKSDKKLSKHESGSIEDAMNDALETLQKAAFDSEAPPPRRSRRSRSVQQPPPRVKVVPVELSEVETWTSYSQRLMLLDRFPALRESRRKVATQEIDTDHEGNVTAVRRRSLDDGIEAGSGDDISLDVSTASQSYEADDALNMKISLWTGDIARLKVDAVLNDANGSLLGTAGGVNGSIHRQAGDRLRVSCAHILEENGGEVPPGSAVVTPAFDLPAKFIIHAVAGEFDESADDEEDVKKALSDCYTKALEASGLDGSAFESIAFCDIGRSKARDVEVALRCVRDWLEGADSDGTKRMDRMRRIVFTVSDSRMQELYEQLMRKYFQSSLESSSMEDDDDDDDDEDDD